MKKILFTLSLISSLYLVDAKDYKAGEIQSKTAFHYGKFETRFYASDVSGVLSTMFLFENDGWKETDIWQEIDVEVFGKSPRNQWQSNLIYETNAAGPQKHSEDHHSFENSSVAAWHTYTVEWTPDYVKWLVDGEEVRKITDKSILDIIGAKPMLVMFNCWSHEEAAWVGPLEEDRLPAYQFVDYIRVYDWIADEQFENEPSFADDFNDSLSDWNVSQHTFEGNIADFVPQNVGTKDGFLILCVSPNGMSNLIKNAVVPSPTLGVSNNDSQLNANLLYPNPSKNQINIIGDSWSIYSMDGIQVLAGEENSVNIELLTTGVYHVQITKDGKQFFTKFFKD